MTTTPSRQPPVMRDALYIAIASSFEVISGLSTAKTFHVIPVGAHYAWVQAEGQNVRFRTDAGVPTSTVGSILYKGDYIWFDIAGLSNIKFIETAASASLNVHYFKG